MRLIRRSNPGAYRQPRCHIAVDDLAGSEGASTLAICGTDVAAVKGDRRGSYRPARLSVSDVETLPGIGGDYSLCAKCRAKASPKPATPKMSVADMKALHARACAAGDIAFAAATPTPMIVYEPGDMMASLTGGDDGGLENAKRIYPPVMDGVCGFAWVNLRPANSKFANWARKEGIGSTDSYSGGLSIREYGGDRYSQSLTRQEAAARAYAEVLRDAGLSAHARSRID